MNSILLRKTALAFLAGRYPAAYTAEAITQRLDRSGLLDEAAGVPAVLAELRLLATKFGWVDLMVDPDGVQHWGATTSGVRQWTLDGSLYVGG